MTKNNKEYIYISLQEATRYCNYSQEYLSLRARQKKLKSIKFGRNWVTTKEWLDEYLQEAEQYHDYMSLQKAAGYCNYSQEYLSLRARQKKLRAIKFGRNWVTTKEWLDEYLQEAEHYPAIEKQQEEPKIAKVEPYLLPAKKVPTLRFGFAVALILVLFLAGGVFSKEGFKNVFRYIPVLAQELSQAFNKGTANLSLSFDIGTKKLKEQSVNYVYNLAAGLEGAFREYGQWFTGNIKRQFANLKTHFLFVGNFFNKKLSTENKKEGMVVIPSTKEDEAIKEKIKKSFSDEVKVEPKDESSGIITPVFKEGDGERYFYIMVPVKNN